MSDRFSLPQLSLADYQPQPSAEALLAALPGPVVYHLPGRDRSRCRLAVTLQHGNEPSGLKAVWQLLQELHSGQCDWQPAVDLLLCLTSVEAARTPPLFFHRQLPGMRDLNRCYQPPFNDGQGMLARAVLDLIEQYQPEAIVDLHNTSGSGPAFGVSVLDSANHRALTDLFCERLIVTPIRLGSLMEQTPGCPVVTIEAGGAQDESAHSAALEGLRNFAITDDLYADRPLVDVLRHPRRLELRPDSLVAYAAAPGPEHRKHTLVLDAAIESHNFGITAAGECLGWISASNWSHLRLTTPAEGHRVEDYFTLVDGQLRTRQALRLFMVTTRPDIALSDCLFYFVPVSEAH